MFAKTIAPSGFIPTSNPACALRILIAARGAEAAGLARALFEEGYNVTLRTSPEDVIARLIDASPVPALVIIDPLDMASCLPNFVGLKPRPAMLAATGERRPAELIRALQSGLYQGWLPYPLAPDEALPIIADTLHKRREAGLDGDLARTLLEAANDIIHAARGYASGADSQEEAHLAIRDGLEIAAAVGDFQALMEGEVYFRPAFRTVQTLLRPILKTWMSDKALAEIRMEFGEAAHIGLKCDGPLLRRAISLMLMRANHHASREGSIQIMTAGGEALTLSVIAACGDGAMHRQPWRYGAFCEVYCARIAHMHEGVFASECHDLHIAQRLTVSAQAGPWPEG